MTTRIPALAAVVALLALAGCGSGSSSSSAPASTAAATASGPQQIEESSSSLGTILTDGSGKTIYLFERDRGPRSTCSGACLAEWPAVTTHGRPQASGGPSTAMLGTSRRGDGATQVTYAGHPLYYYSGDGAAGDTNGQALDAFGAEWYVLAPSGTAITRQPSGGSARGYGY